MRTLAVLLVCATACVVLAPCAVADENPSVQAWARYFNAFAASEKPDATTQLSVLTSPQGLDTTNTMQLKKHVYHLCNNEPNRELPYELTAFAIDDSYGNFLNNLMVKTDPGQENEVYKYGKELDTAKNALTQCQTDKWAEYDDWVKKGGDWGERWTKMNPPDSICPGKQATYDMMAAQLKKLSAAAAYSTYKDIAEARTDYENLGTGYVMQIAGDPDSVQVKACTADGLVTKVSDWNHGQTNPGSFKLNQASSHSIDTHVEGGGKASYGSWFSIGGGASGGKDVYQKWDDSLTIEIGWQAKESVPLTRGKWWDGSMLTTHGSKSSFQESSPYYTDPSKLFGPKGVLGQVPTSLTLVYQPSVTVTTSSSYYSKIHKEFSAGASVCIFGFCAGGSGGSSSTKVDWNEAGTSFTITDKSTVPKVVAVSSALYDVQSESGGSSGFLLRRARRSRAVSVDTSGFKVHEGVVDMKVTGNSVSLATNAAHISGVVRVKAV